MKDKYYKKIGKLIKKLKKNPSEKETLIILGKIDKINKQKTMNELSKLF